MKIENRFFLILLIFILISLVGYFDFITGDELSFSFFYIIPISLLALSKQMTIPPILFSSFFASVLWFLSEYLTRTYSSILYPIWNGNVRLLIFSIIGVTLFYLRKKQEQLNKLNYELKILNDEKNKFIGIAAHDLRNPVGGVYALAKYLYDDFDQLSEKDILDSVKLIKDSSNNSLSIISNLLDVSKIEAGKVELNIKKHDYISFIKNIYH